MRTIKYTSLAKGRTVTGGGGKQAGDRFSLKLMRNATISGFAAFVPVLMLLELPTMEIFRYSMALLCSTLVLFPTPS
jgi:hypothetical protein